MAYYPHGQSELQIGSYRRRTAENSAGYLLERLRPGLALLDVGCGPASITADLAGRVAPGRVVGVDADPGAINVARDTLAGRGLTSVELATADVHALAFPDGTFDVVHAHQVLQYAADPAGALREMRRVCKPGGIVAARDADYSAMTWFPLDKELDEWLALYRRTAVAAGGQPDAGRRLLAWAHEAGFADVTATASVWCMAGEDRTWWSEMWAGRVNGPAFTQETVRHGLATGADLDRLSAAWRHWGEDPDGWFTILHGEIIAIA